MSPALPRTTSADVAAPEPGTVQPPDTGTQGLSAIASSAPATPEVPGPAPLTANEVRAEFWTGFAQGTFLFGAQILKDQFEQSGLGGMGLMTAYDNLVDRYHDNGGGFCGAGKTVLDLVDPTGPLGVISTGAGDIVKGVLDADPRSVGATAAVVTWSVVIAVATAGGGKAGEARQPTGSKGTPAPGGRSSRRPDDPVRGFRAVSKAEARDISRHGFRPDPAGRSMESKWFSESRQGAEWFRKNLPGLDKVVEARVPRSVYERSYRHANIDGTGPGFCVDSSDLPRISPILK